MRTESAYAQNPQLLVTDGIGGSRYGPGTLAGTDGSLEAARYAADKAFRQYGATDPANQLVAAELELRWNRTLKRVAELENRMSEPPTRMPISPEDFATLAFNRKTIWREPATDVRLKKRIVRELIREVIADLEAAGGEIVLIVHWTGGVHPNCACRAGGADSATAPQGESSKRCACSRAFAATM